MNLEVTGITHGNILLTHAANDEMFPKFEFQYATMQDGSERSFLIRYGDTGDIEDPGVIIAHGDSREELQENFIKFFMRGMAFMMHTRAVKPVIPVYRPIQPILGNGGRASASMYADTLRINYGYAGPAHLADNTGRDMYKYYQKWSKINDSK